MMAELDIRHLPILSGGVPVGMLSARDVNRYQYSHNARQCAVRSTGKEFR